jgi:hypothetical protein
MFPARKSLELLRTKLPAWGDDQARYIDVTYQETAYVALSLHLFPAPPLAFDIASTCRHDLSLQIL